MRKILEKIVSDEIESGRLVLGKGVVKEFSIGYSRTLPQWCGKSQKSIVPVRCDVEFVKTIYITGEAIVRYNNRDKRDKIISELLD